MTDNEILFTIIFGLSFSLVIFLWVEGLDYMKRTHPDYKGDDLLDEEEEDDNE